MNPKFSLTFNPSGSSLVFRGRLASRLFYLDLELNSLVYFDPYSLTKYCPDNYSSIRSEKFLSRFFSLSSHEQSVCISLYESVLLEDPSPVRLRQRDFYSRLLKYDLDVTCRSLSSKSQFIVCFLYAYYALLLKHYDPEFSFDTHPF